MGRNNKQNRKRRESIRHAELVRNRTRQAQEKARRERDPRFHTLRNASIDAAREYLAEGKSPAEAKALIKAELAGMMRAKGNAGAEVKT